MALAIADGEISIPVSSISFSGEYCLSAFKQCSPKPPTPQKRSHKCEIGKSCTHSCASADGGGNFYCQYHTGSTNNTWRLVNVNLNNVPGYGSMLGESDVIFTWGFSSDLSYTARGPIVDVVRIRATGPNN